MQSDRRSAPYRRKITGLFQVWEVITVLPVANLCCNDFWELQSCGCKQSVRCRDLSPKPSGCFIYPPGLILKNGMFCA
jgi:hypothetical protein